MPLLSHSFIRTLEKSAQGAFTGAPLWSIILLYTQKLQMIDLSQLTEEQLNELELQIQKHKEEQKHKDNLKNLKGYKVTFYVRFDPEKHKDDDMLTDDGELDPNIFADYLCDNVASRLSIDFDFNGYEDVSYPNVEVATQQEIEEKF